MQEFEPWSAKSAFSQSLAIDAETRHRVIQQSGARAQVATEKILTNQNELLEYIVKHAHQQGIDLQERNKIEAERYRINTKISKIAAWASVISTIIGVISIILAAIAIWEKQLT